ncbi:MAG: hypothetical protein ACXVJJ_06175 [Halobacteriota archaeon]
MSVFGALTFFTVVLKAIHLYPSLGDCDAIWLVKAIHLYPSLGDCDAIWLGDFIIVTETVIPLFADGFSDDVFADCVVCCWFVQPATDNDVIVTTSIATATFFIIGFTYLACPIAAEERKARLLKSSYLLAR